MAENGNQDHLSSSLTDLMTSLMVIFVLLLLSFLSRTAGKNAAVTDALLKVLKRELVPQGFREQDIVQDKKDRNAILVVVPDQLMNFEIGEFRLRPEGETFLQNHIPTMAKVLCGKDYRSSIESVIVEGHTDTNRYIGHTPEESENLNLKLSQDRSMEVVKSSLAILSAQPEERGCFLEMLSASGRGEQDQQETAADSRRVIFKIRVRADQAKDLQATVGP